MLYEVITQNDAVQPERRNTPQNGEEYQERMNFDAVLQEKGAEKIVKKGNKEGAEEQEYRGADRVSRA